jgi:N-acetyl-anhydromuramyl-L-alanine amidase AmpD
MTTVKLPPLLVVIHETYINLEQSLDLHSDPDYIASYHAVIERGGEIYYLVPPDKKAFAARNSSFINPVTQEVEQIEGSVDDFAYHIALETPLDGRDSSKKVHSGYTYEQYNSLAWLIRATGVELNRLTTHGDISQSSNSKPEPRCLNLDFLMDTIFNKNNSPSLNFGILLGNSN